MTVKNTFIPSFVVLTSLLLLVCLAVFRPWQHFLSTPVNYFGDSFFSMMIVKNTMQSSFWTNAHLGTPFGMNLLDFVSTDSTNVALVKIASLLSGDPVVVTNLFLWLSFLTTGWVSFFVARRLGLSPGFSLLLSLLFALTPYHLSRNIQHLFLGSYFVAPLVIYICLMITKTVPFNKVGWPLMIVTAWLSATTGLYYAFFSLLLVLFATGVRVLNKPRFSELKLSFIFFLVMGLGLLYNLWPSYQLWNSVGNNPTIAKRLPAEAENNGLKLYQLALPLNNYNFSLLTKYHQKIETNLEAKQYMGVVGVVGLVVSFLVLMTSVFKKVVQANPLLSALSQMNAFLLVLGLTGGIGSFIALVAPQIRAYSRLLPFLLFGCLMVTALVSQTLLTQSQKRTRPWILLGMLVIFVVSFWDQVSWYQLPSQTTILQIRQEQQFLATIEATVGADTHIYQLPYKPFPESPPIHNLEDYDLLKGYLFSSRLNWSYGVIKGREGDQFFHELSQKPPSTQLTVIKNMGFDGIYIDRTGFVDSAIAVESSFSALLQKQPLVSENQTLSFFDIR